MAANTSPKPSRPETSSRGVVLVVEDEPAIADIERRYLTREGFGVHVERDGDAALAAVGRLRPVAVLLDVGLPGRSGTEVCQAMRARGDWTPVLFVTARDEEVERVLGLELGADDYIVKPFSPAELVARLKAVLRRGRREPDLALQVGSIVLSPAERRVLLDDVVLTLTTTEFDLLATLMREPGRVFTRDRLLSLVWGYEAAAGSRTVDVHVSQLRSKLGQHDLIRTVRGVGYSIESRG